MKHTESAIVLVFNSTHKLALQLRAAGDAKYPSHWDFSAAGGIEVGETPLHAAHRELKEEIGIAGELKFVREILFTGEHGEDNLFIYSMHHDGPFILDPVEVDDIQFFSLKEIDHMVESKEKFHPEFLFLWNHGFFKSFLIL